MVSAIHRESDLARAVVSNPEQVRAVPNKFWLCYLNQRVKGGRVLANRQAIQLIYPRDVDWNVRRRVIRKKIKARRSEYRSMFHRPWQNRGPPCRQNVYDYTSIATNF